MVASRMAECWALFDLNGTLLDPGTILRADEALAHGALDDAVAQAMADTLTGEFRPLPGYLEAALARRGLAGDELAAALDRARRLDPFPEAAEALAVLRDAGIRRAVVTNSAGGAAREALGAAGLEALVEEVVGGDEVGVYKPHRHVYQHAVRRLHAEPRHATLVAAHWWDVLGAKRCGLRTGWVARRERELLGTVPAPDHRGEDLLAVARSVAAA
jgi:2-haloacid dehalogenase